VTALGTNVAQITLGAHFGCALKTDSTVWCWGATDDGQLGNGQTMRSSTSQCSSGGCESSPVQVTGLTDAAQVAAGRDFACVKKKTGAIVCWGNSSNGYLGEGTYRAKISCASSYCEPAPVPVCQ
jgi:alpha-tubulin suppressor-like RCC1 family protein